MSVNDPFVVTAFASKLGGGQHINYIADGNGEFTKALGLDFDLSAVQLGPIRMKRCSLVVKNNSLIEVNNEDGAAYTETSAPSTILTQLKKQMDATVILIEQDQLQAKRPFARHGRGGW